MERRRESNDTTESKNTPKEHFCLFSKDKMPLTKQFTGMI